MMMMGMGNATGISFPCLFVALVLAAGTSAEYENCTGDVDTIEDGECTSENNNPSCGYDGGDCCICTCAQSTQATECFFASFICLDPDAGSEFYDCNRAPPASALFPCASDIPSDWVVENTSQAMALAEATNCSDGVFNIEWRGSIAVGTTIYVMERTVLNVTGVGAGAGVDLGRAEAATEEIRAFTVINASLYLSDMHFSYGNATVGGAIAATGSSLTLTRTSFVDNAAKANGGAMYLVDETNVTMSGETRFQGNEVSGDGGAIYCAHGSSLSWDGETSFLDNTAGWDGGAVYADCGSVVSWTGETVFTGNIGPRGGAIHLYKATLFSRANTAFLGNSAQYAGAVEASTGSTISFGGEGITTSFVKNTASGYGGVLIAHLYSNIMWDGIVTFSNNSASQGGALYANARSGFSWSGETKFAHNIADYGGGLALFNYGTLSWSGQTTFLNNSAISGAAMLVVDDATVHWTGETVFSQNSAERMGGAMYIDNATTSWSDGEVSFKHNNAENGGAVFLQTHSTLSWSGGTTTFTSNEAHADGGGMGSSLSPVTSTVAIMGTTYFIDNASGSNGGALALRGGVAATFDENTLTFTGNSAGVAGGAVFISGTGIGPVFVGAEFVSNFAQVGGAVYATGSGTTVAKEEANPTTFAECVFFKNQAGATGGAVESGAGLDLLVNSSFVGNTAGVGGALRLAGTASVTNCSFLENSSDEGGGSAVSNIGFISQFSNSSFMGNLFLCLAKTYLDYETSDDLYESVCHGCDTQCEGCTFDVPPEVPLCYSELEHSTSSGGNVTIETLDIHEGYWRAKATSPNVLPCYNEDACLGGVTGSSMFCKQGYEGPYCSVCSDGYTASLGFTCNKCSGTNSNVALAIFALVLAVLLWVLLVWYMIAGGLQDAGRGIVSRLRRHIPLQSIKIVIVAWQILTQFAAVANVTFPGVYQRFLDGVDVLNFDITWVLSAGCFIHMDFHDRLLLSTIGPILFLAFLGFTYVFATWRNRGSSPALRNVRQKHLSMVLLVTFLVYSSVSSTLFQMFACEGLDDDKNYLRADYRIQCNSHKHVLLQIYAGFMIALYTAGIPVFYAVLLYKNRHVLAKGAGIEGNSRVKSTSDLWKPYKPGRFYYEVIECGRRILLAGVVVFIYPNTSAQVAITLLIAFTFALISEGLAPYASTWDAWISRTGHVIIFMSFFSALLLKVDVSNERLSSQRVFEVILVSAHACVILAVIVETVVTTCALRKERHEDAWASFRWGDSGVMSFQSSAVASSSVQEEVDSREALPRFGKRVAPYHWRGELCMP